MPGARWGRKRPAIAVSPEREGCRPMLASHTQASTTLPLRKRSFAGASTSHCRRADVAAKEARWREVATRRAEADLILARAAYEAAVERLGQTGPASWQRRYRLTGDDYAAVLDGGNVSVRLVYVWAMAHPDFAGAEAA